MSKQGYYVINGITFYRLIAAPFLIWMVAAKREELFSWLLALSFFTDSIDGYLARRYKITSVMGARIDSIADDLTVAAAIAGMFVFKPAFMNEQYILLVLLAGLYLVQLLLAIVRYGRMTSFHTYTAKLAAVCQGVFFILLFFLPQPVDWLFYIAAITTLINIAEEIILVIMLPCWEADVKGLFWIIKRRDLN